MAVFPVKGLPTSTTQKQSKRALPTLVRQQECYQGVLPAAKVLLPARGLQPQSLPAFRGRHVLGLGSLLSCDCLQRNFDGPQLQALQHRPGLRAGNKAGKRGLGISFRRSRRRRLWLSPCPSSASSMHLPRLAATCATENLGRGPSSEVQASGDTVGKSLQTAIISWITTTPGSYQPEAFNIKYFDITYYYFMGPF